MLTCLVLQLPVHHPMINFERKAREPLVASVTNLTCTTPRYVRSGYNGILVRVRTSFGLRGRGGKTYNVSTYKG